MCLRTTPLEISAVDYANYIWEYEYFSVSIILNYYRRDSKRTMELVCDKGSYLVNLLKTTLLITERKSFHQNKRDRTLIKLK